MFAYHKNKLVAYELTQHAQREQKERERAVVLVGLRFRNGCVGKRAREREREREGEGERERERMLLRERSWLNCNKISKRSAYEREFLGEKEIRG